LVQAYDARVERAESSAHVRRGNASLIGARWKKILRSAKANGMSRKLEARLEAQKICARSNKKKERFGVGITRFHRD
jgi:hypothetical protein